MDENGPKHYYETDIYHFPSPYIVFHGIPGTTFTKTDPLNPGGPRVEIKLNELGFRIEKPLPSEKPPGEKRIFVVGSSTVFHGFPLVNSISGQIEMCFRREGRNEVQVYNFGFVSSVSGQELSLLTHVLADYNPDVVVVINGGNDICLPANFDPRPGYPYNFIAYEAAMRRIRLEPRDGYNQWILHGEGLEYDITAVRDACGYGSPAWETAIVAGYVKNLVKMGRFARGFGFRLFAFLEPILFLKNPLVGEERNIPPPYNKENFPSYVVRQYLRIRKMFDYLGRAEDQGKVLFADLSSVFDGYNRPAFWDYRHVDNDGSRHIAERVYDYLQRVI